ncbi:putative benzoate 4-monooxygenase cytochrome P450 [Aspergillus heteromorphus CBS 117.55]|uniref:Putative benzoate 4-monooxygenase cytochrome P450 n=1 Tax=Aspergillus heteromorphus CBS 117.55 TaxID=1448321 RepID=A0A317WDA9_9EURO|nr:putative benzoate 4-monooxygenase cytochrome P450 [Aspergillus heteromorphus CBS 117.55]PWY82160.1 putative benzoate 4-monooxygenase cytochrome P450 [Aspergillus heteromorphus CBS 117.55]
MLLDPWTVGVYGTACYLIYAVALVIYRFYYHPLAHIPGPTLAKGTYLFEWYYDLYLGGQLTFKLQELHEEYGPVIRINPDEVHIHDPDFFDEVYNQTNGRAVKPQRVAEVFGPYPAAMGTQTHELHHIRRSALNPLFSRRSVQNLVPTMRKSIDILCTRLYAACKSDETFNMKHMYAALTLDIINDFCFAMEPQSTAKSDFDRKWFDDLDTFLEFSLLSIHIPWVMSWGHSIPDSINKILAPAMADLLDFRQDISLLVEAIRHSRDKSHEKTRHNTVIHDLLQSKLPPPELERDRLRDEVFSLVTAGSGTTAYVLRGTAYHISASPTIQTKLHQELQSAIPDPTNPPPLPDLEKLPYLCAVINEGLRLCDPAAHRTERQLPDKTLNCHGTVIPAGTMLGMTSFLTHRNEQIYPDPLAFRPERWLGNEGKRLDRYLVSFGRGPRACVGMNLARAELVLILAAVFRRFYFDVKDVSRERDIELSRDCIVAAQAKDSPGILVKVRVA